MKYNIQVDVHKWKQNHIIDEKELLLEGVDIKQWEKQGLIKQYGVPESVKEEVSLDLNGDGKVDKEDKKIARKVLFKSNKNKKGKR